MDAKSAATMIAQRPKVNGPIRVTVPVSVAYDLDKMQKVLANLAESIGHSACLSGADCTLLNLRDWLVDPASLSVNRRPTADSGGAQ